MKITLNSPQDMVDYCNYLNDKEKLGETLANMLGDVELTENEADSFYSYKKTLGDVAKNPVAEETTTRIVIPSKTSKIVKTVPARSNKIWDKAELARLKTFIDNGVNIETTAAQLNRTIEGIRHKAAKFYNKRYFRGKWLVDVEYPKNTQ